jgi:hypothetical protein
MIGDMGFVKKKDATAAIEQVRQKAGERSKC